MPAYLPSAGLGCKLVTLFPGNTDRPTHQAAIMLFDPETGTPVVLMDGTYVTEARTAGAAALAARLLAREDAKVLAILGTGAQARAHARAFARVRDWSEIRIAGRDRTKAAELAAEVGAIAAASFEDAVRGADVVAATTHSPDPVVRREWLAPGTHVSSVGATQSGGEVDPAIVADATLVVETRAALAPPPAGASELAGLEEAATPSSASSYPVRDPAEPPRSKLLCTSQSESRCRIWRQRHSSSLWPGSAGPASRSIWRRSTHERVQPRPRGRRRLRDGNRRA
jgi:hypothetical protein